MTRLPGYAPACTVKRERLLPLIVATALFIENMDSTAIATSLPAIALDFGVEPVALKLALTTYMLALAVFLACARGVAVMEQFRDARSIWAQVTSADAPASR